MLDRDLSRERRNGQRVSEPKGLNLEGHPPVERPSGVNPLLDVLGPLPNVLRGALQAGLHHGPVDRLGLQLHDRLGHADLTSHGHTPAAFQDLTDRLSQPFAERAGLSDLPQIERFGLRVHG